MRFDRSLVWLFATLALAPALASERADEPVRVAYLDGGASWNHRYLKNVLLRDRGLETRVFLDVEGASQEATSGVLPFDACPRSFVDVDVVVLGALCADRLDALGPELDAFVRRGGGLLVIVGRTAPRQRELDGILPVIGAEAPFVHRARTGRLELTDAGAAMPALRLTADPRDNRTHWRTLPPVVAGVGRVTTRPGARVLASLGEAPVIVEGAVGRGACLFVGTDELWRWRGAGEHDRLFRQLVRHLAPLEGQ